METEKHAKLSLCVKHAARHGSADIAPRIPDFATREGEWSALRPSSYTHRETAPGTHWTVSWVGPRAGLDAMDRRYVLPLPGIEPLIFGRPVRRPSVYLLSYCPSH